MKIENTYSKKIRKEKPQLPWQTGDYERLQTLRYHIPYPFLLLCKLWGVTPDKVLAGFMHNLGSDGWNKEVPGEAKIHLRQYVIAMGYGKEHYTTEDIQQMFSTLDALGGLWPHNAKMKMIKRHARWRNKYYHWWFKQTWRKYKRKPLNKPAE